MIAAILMWLAAAGGIGQSQTASAASEAASTQPTQTAADSASSSTTRIPHLTSHVYPEGISDETAYLAWLEQERERLGQFAAGAAGAEQARRSLYLANWILAIRCEPHVSRLVQGVSDGGDASELVRLGGVALSGISGAESDITAAGDQEQTLQESAEYLTHFGHAVVQYGRALDGAADPKALQDAVNDLAIWLDDERSPIAGAAALWQSLLYQAGGQPQGALAVLPSPLTPVQGDAIAFFARVQRCWTLGQTNHSAVALALLLRMEERVEQWFQQAGDIQDALCTLTWARVRVANAANWSLGELARTTMEKWVARAEDALAESGETCELFRLRPAIPFLLSETAGGAAALPPWQKTPGQPRDDRPAHRPDRPDNDEIEQPPGKPARHDDDEIDDEGAEPE